MIIYLIFANFGAFGLALSFIFLTSSFDTFPASALVFARNFQYHTALKEQNDICFCHPTE
jgi:hypothetical protein